ncbi:hypothetical protein BH10BDE1_BH10BDE1_26810 [soil metagenome]
MILSASGGLVYHARAAFTRIESLISVSGEDRWAPTRRCVSTHVRNWLTDVQPDTLIIFGPSAGYLLEPDFFQALPREASQAPLKIVAVDPDRLARTLFQRRFRSSEITWHLRHDLLPFGSENPSAFANFLDSASLDSPNVAVLFLGLLGQIPLHSEMATRSAFEARRILQNELADFHWASLHDLESTNLQRGLRELPAALRPESFAEPSVAQFLSTTTARAEFTSNRFHNLGVPVTAWTDHDTEWLSPPDVVIPWLLSRRRFHHLGFSKTSIVVTG